MKPPVVYTGGTFDLLHWGHVSFLERCHQFGIVTVALNSDEFIAKFKGKPPVMSYIERKKALLGCRWVARVIENTGGSDSKPAIEWVKPNVIAIGSDWAKRDYYKQMGFTQDWLDSKNIALTYIPYTKDISTTDIKARFAKPATQKIGDTCTQITGHTTYTANPCERWHVVSMNGDYCIHCGAKV